MKGVESYFQTSRFEWWPWEFKLDYVLSIRRLMNDRDSDETVDLYEPQTAFVETAVVAVELHKFYPSEVHSKIPS